MFFLGWHRAAPREAWALVVTSCCLPEGIRFARVARMGRLTVFLFDKDAEDAAGIFARIRIDIDSLFNGTLPAFAAFPVFSALSTLMLGLGVSASPWAAASGLKNCCVGLGSRHFLFVFCLLENRSIGLGSSRRPLGAARHGVLAVSMRHGGGCGVPHRAPYRVLASCLGANWAH